MEGKHKAMYSVLRFSTVYCLGSDIHRPAYIMRSRVFYCTLSAVMLMLSIEEVIILTFSYALSILVSCSLSSYSCFVLLFLSFLFLPPPRPGSISNHTCLH